MSWRRIKAIIMQNAFVMRRSPLRLMELLYWPLIEVVLWGFISNYLLIADADIYGGVKVLLGAVVLWDVMFRSQQELAVTYLMDVWDRNILNLMASPIRQSEYFLGGLIFSVARVMFGTTMLVLVARFAFDFDLLRAGATLIPAFIILVGMGWSLGLLIRAALLRFGIGAEVLAWSVAFLLQPVSAVFYPVDVLPTALEKVAFFIPASHVFEALRAFFATGDVLAGSLVWAAALDVLYLVLSAGVAMLAFGAVRRKGLLSRPGY